MHVAAHRYACGYEPDRAYSALTRRRRLENRLGNPNRPVPKKVGDATRRLLSNGLENLLAIAVVVVACVATTMEL